MAIPRSSLSIRCALLLIALLTTLFGASPAHAQADAVPPSVASKSPEAGASGVGVSAIVTATFSEPVQGGTVGFELRTSSGTLVVAAVTYDPRRRTAALDPVNDLAPGQTYTATVTAAQDLAGLALAASVTWTFGVTATGFNDPVVLSGLTEPLSVQFAPDGRVFVAEKRGTIRVFDSLSDPTPDLFADLQTQVHDFGERGLLGLAIDPAFPTRPYVYALYALDAAIGGAAPLWGLPNTPGDPCPNLATTGCVVGARLSRLTATGNQMTAQQVLVEDWFQQFPGQSIGDLVFGPDGALYASAGDGAHAALVDTGQLTTPSADPPNQGGALRSQDLQTPADPVTLGGTVIRVHPDTGLPLPRVPTMTVGAPVTDGNGVRHYPVTSLFLGPTATTVRVISPTNPAPGRPPRLVYVLPVEAGVTDLGSQFGDGFEELRLLDVPNRFNATLIAPSLPIEPWYGDHATNPDRRLESFMVNDLVPFGDSFAPAGTAPPRWLIGFSKSGHGALSLILRHPHVFSAAAAWDAPVQFTNMSAFTSMVENFGTENQFDRYEIPTLVTSSAAAFLQRNRLWISGDVANWTSDMQQLDQQMTQAGVLHTYAATGTRTHSWASGWIDGAVIALDANAGSTNPIDLNESRITAWGLRRPARIAFRPGTSELWLGDIGPGTVDEVNRVTNVSDGTLENFGWPCYLGATPNSAYAASPICQALAAQPGAVQSPQQAYATGQPLFAGDTCTSGAGSGITGLAFAGLGVYPPSFSGALFLADRLRRCVWAVPVNASGQLNPAASMPVLTNAASPAVLNTAPSGQLFYADADGGTVRRIEYLTGNQTPTAVIQPSATSGPSPLVVTFSAAASSDPEGAGLSYAWDLDGDGAFDDSTAVQPTSTYTGYARHTVQLRVQDPQGLSHVETVDIITDDTPPIVTITAPTTAINWDVGQVLAFSGSATDTEDGTLAPANLAWSLIANHCPSACHGHVIQTFAGVASGSFTAPDHEYPSTLELRLTATDSLGLQSTTSVVLQPRTVSLTFDSIPTGLQITVGSATSPGPIARTVIVGSSNPVSVTSPQAAWQFVAWSDGGAQSHTIVAPASSQTYTATFQVPPPPPGLLAAYGFNEGIGTVAQSAVGTFPGTLSNATWTTAGRFGNAVSFNGTNAMVSVADANALDLTTGMTLEAWVWPTATTGVRDILIKEGTGVDIYNLYARNGSGQPESNVFVGGSNRWATGPILPVNTWSHVAGTYDGTTVRLFVNGLQVGSAAFSGVISTSTGALRIGGNSIWGEFFQGHIDEIRIYSRALTAAEIQADMTTPVGAFAPDTTPPLLSNPIPTGTLAAGTTQTTLGITANEPAVCRYSSTAGTAYSTMPATFSATGGTTHTTTVTGLTNGGIYAFYVRCQDTTGNANATDTPINFTVAQSGGDTTPPSVSITAPAAGSTVAGVVSITATASDNVGVAGVQFLLDGSNLGPEDTTAPYSLAWDTTTGGSGSHVLSARARDLSGNVGTSTTVGVAAVNGQVPANFIDEVVIGSGVTFPTAFEFLPDGRMLIAEFTGRILVVAAGGSVPNATPVLQLTNFFGEDVTIGGERGLVNVVADPNFATNGYIYLFYTASSPQRDRVSRFTMVGNTASVATELVVWQAAADSTSTDHHGGGLAFGVDGKLYISTGDNGDAPSAQPLTSDHGKLLRVDSDGTVPTDNPFFDGNGPNIDAIWARGLRNPYRFSFDFPTGRMYIGDVGLSAIEEVNLGAAGANYGWPICEGPCGTSGMTNPIFNYPHSGHDAAVTGGFVYRGTQFPLPYQGAYFYGDFAQNWIRYLTFDAAGAVTGGSNFLPVDGALDGPYDPVMLKPGPDGSLYYVDFGWGWLSTANPAAIRRIRYVAGNQPPVAVASANPLTGTAPLTVTFSSAGSLDPEGQSLSYDWSFGDGSSSALANPSHVYTLPGQYAARLVVSDGNTSISSATINISVGTPPAGTITSPVNGSRFRAGDVIAFAGTAIDAEDGTLSGSAMTWTVLFHHDSHVHPAVPPTSGTASGTFAIQTSGHDFSGATSYEVILTVVDSNGLQSTSSVTIIPDKVNLTFVTSPAGLAVTVDGISRQTPFALDTLIGFQHAVVAPAQQSGGINYTFGSWSDGGSQSHTIVAPASAQTFTATFQAPPPPPTLIAAYAFDEDSGPTATAAGGTNANGSLVNGPIWTSGRYGGALDFDGVNDYVVVNNPLNLPTGDFTFEAWVQLDAVNDESIIMIANTAGGNEFFLAVEGGRVGAYVDGTRRTRSAVNSVVASTWRHVAVRRLAGQIQIYLNGAPSGASATYAGALNFGTCALFIGVDIDSGCSSGLGNYADGRIDEVRIYQRALSQAEIQADMNTPIGGAPDTTPPTLTAGQPTGTLPAGTTATALGVTTHEAASCRYGTTAGLPYASMPSAFATTGGTSHTSPITGLVNGSSYTYYLRCQDTAGNANTTDFSIVFSVNDPPPPDITPPTVTLTGPANAATVSGVVAVSATASDNVGVVGVQFLLNGVPLGAEVTTAPYGTSWNSASVSNGSHQLSARARDAAGNQTTSAVVTVTVSNVVASGLIAAYGFNEGAGTVVHSSVGTFPGTISNATWSAAGRFGNALSFNGLNAMVTVADAAALDLTTGMTLEAWVYPTAATGVRDILIKEGTGVDIYNLYARNGQGQAEANVFVNGTNWWAASPTALPLNMWSHVTGTFDGTTIRLYVNGVHIGAASTAGAITTSTGALRIGGNSLWGEFFQGQIDEIRIYNRPLSAAEVQADMNTPVGP